MPTIRVLFPSGKLREFPGVNLKVGAKVGDPDTGEIGEVVSRIEY